MRLMTKPTKDEIITRYADMGFVRVPALTLYYPSGTVFDIHSLQSESGVDTYTVMVSSSEPNKVSYALIGGGTVLAHTFSGVFDILYTEVEYDENSV